MRPRNATGAAGTAVRLLACLGVLATHPEVVRAQPGADPRYRTRASDCRHEPPPGRPLAVLDADSVNGTHGYTAVRIVSVTADASRLSGGDLVVCTEYGRVEITDSDDGRVRLQVRLEGFGEGSTDPAAAAARAIGETRLHTSLTESGGRLLVRVWHSTLGFTIPGAQPVVVSVRLQVPSRGGYSVRTEAFHGAVAIRRLRLERASLRGNVGDKFKGVPGFIGATELDHVTLAGQVDIDNLAGLPGIRPAVPQAMAALAAPIVIKARVAASSAITATTGGDITIAVQPAPDLGVEARGETTAGRVRITVEAGVAAVPDGDSPHPVRRLVRSPGYEDLPVRIAIRAASGGGTVTIASVPAAPFAPAGRPR